MNDEERLLVDHFEKAARSRTDKQLVAIVRQQEKRIGSLEDAVGLEARELVDALRYQEDQIAELIAERDALRELIGRAKALIGEHECECDELDCYERLAMLWRRDVDKEKP